MLSRFGDVEMPLSWVIVPAEEEGGTTHYYHMTADRSIDVRRNDCFQRIDVF